MTKTKLISRCASEIPMEHVRWVWPARIAKGKHTMIGGEPGTGKSQLMIDIAARVSMGAAFPCGEGMPSQGSIIILSAEDGDADTIIPRLHAAGADLGRVHIVKATRVEKGGQRGFNLQLDIEELEKLIEELGDVVLIIIDPISSYLGKGTDSHKNSEVRGVLEPLSLMAERTHVAVVSVTHLNKTIAGGVQKAINRFIGSIAFIAAPRIVLAVCQDKDDPGRRLVLHSKNNIAPPPQGLAFRLKQASVGEERIETSCVDWELEHANGITVDEAIGDSGSAKDGDQREAMEFLTDLLSGGRQPAKDVQEAAKAHMIAPRTLRRARGRMGVIIQREGFGKDGVSYWSLPPSILVHLSPENGGNAHRCPLQEVDKYGQNGGGGAPPEDRDDAAVAFEERAAILESDAGLDRQEAEEVAAKELGWPELPPFLVRR